MKKIKKITVSLCMLGLIANNAYCTTNEVVSSSGGYTKYLFMGVAALVIILLLFLGYKMDTKGDDFSISKPQKKSFKKNSSKHQETYEEDSIGYEVDILDTSDINDSVEYEEDETEEAEESLFDSTNNDFDLNIYNNESSEELSEIYDYTENDEDGTEEYGEEFDTSIIDNIDADDDIDISNTNNSFDGTMVFDTSKLNEINDLNDEINTEIEEIDVGLEEIDNLEDVNILETENDPFIDELKNFKEPEVEFGGFSVASSKSEPEEIEADIEKTIGEQPEENNFTDIPVDAGFLEQMEKNQEERTSKKSTRTKKETTTKKTTTRKKKE